MKLLKSFAIVLSVFLLFECLLRLVGIKSGVMLNRFYPVDEVIYEERFLSDSIYGAPFYNKNCACLPNGYQINEQGYRSNLNFDSITVDSLRAQGKFVILSIGDSYTEGCCANPIDSSFMDLIFNRTSNYTTFNAGVGSTGPVHYEKTVLRAFDSYRPNLVLINFYLGNDLVNFRRTVVPGIPQTFPIKDFSWLSSTVPEFYQSKYGKSYFSSPIEAYEFYLDKFTFFGVAATKTEYVFRNSVIVSRLYLGFKNGLTALKWYLSNDIKNRAKLDTRRVLLRIKEHCEINDVQLHISLIPSASEPRDETQVQGIMKEVFSGFSVSYPFQEQFSKIDFDGSNTDNHFNNAGHRKYALYLASVLDSIASSELVAPNTN